MNQRLSCSIEQKLSHNSRFENKNVNANEYENENRNWQCGVTVKTPQFDSKVAPQVKPSDAAALAKKKTDTHIDAVCASASECKLVEKKLASLRYRDPQFQNPLVDCYTLVESTKPCIISDPHGRKCYHPALAYVLGSPTVFNRDIKSMLESASIEQLSSLLHEQHGIEIVRKCFFLFSFLDPAQ